MKESDIVRTGANGRRSSCVAYNGVLYISGITSTNLQGDVKEQTLAILAQLDKIMAVNGTDKHHVLSANIYLQNIDDYAAFNAVWDEWVDDGFEPARSVVGAQLTLPEYRVKISLTVAVG